MDREARIRLVVSDVDGTLLDPDGVLSPVDFVAVGRLRQVGIKFSLCSARPPFGMRWLVRTLGVDCTCAGLNGAIVFRPEGSVVAELPLERLLVEELQERMGRSGLDAWIFTRKQWFVPRLSGPQVRENSDCLRTAPKRYARLGDIPDAILKVVGVHQSPNVVEDCAKELQSEWRDRVCVTISPPHCIDLTHVSADKGQAAGAIASAEGVAKEEVAAIGDSPGDIPMFAAVGTSVAMGQAPAHVRRTASRVTRSNSENGFAWAIESVLNGRRMLVKS